MHRKNFLASLAGIPTLASVGLATISSAPIINTTVAPVPTGVPAPGAAPAKKLKTSLNAFSFNDPLLAGKMTIIDMLDFCAEAGFEGVDITGYYFTGYPTIPADDYLYVIKRK